MMPIIKFHRPPIYHSFNHRRHNCFTGTGALFQFVGRFQTILTGFVEHLKILRFAYRPSYNIIISFISTDDSTSNIN